MLDYQHDQRVTNWLWRVLKNESIAEVLLALFAIGVIVTVITAP